jgi:hypothetical protein
MGNQLIVVIIFVVIAVIRILAQRSSGSSRPQNRGSTTGGTRPPNPYGAPPMRRLPPAPGQPGDDERLRKFMDALGVPAGSVPPVRSAPASQPPYVPRRQPVQVRRQIVQPAPRRAVTPPPPVPVAQPVYQAETVVMQQAAPVEYEVATTPAMPGLGGASVRTPARPAATAMPGDLKSLLRSSSSVRTAVVLREILGQPKGLQPTDVIPGLR